MVGSHSLACPECHAMTSDDVFDPEDMSDNYGD